MFFLLNVSLNMTDSLPDRLLKGLIDLLIG